MAPPNDPTVTTTTYGSTEFLYTGADPIQTGVAPDTIEPKRAAVIRGRVLDRSNQPLSGVTVTILHHPEFGQTLSRADGMFDLAVNGGGVLTLDYQKTDYLPVQRQVDVPWQDYKVADDVVMIGLDPQVTAVALGVGQPMQVARGTPVTDADGTRQATVLFPQGVQATMTLADGSSQPLTTLHVRATEYTVGANGPKTMPAELPPSSGYTYAVELSADEALTAGATRLDFDQPVPFYVENFLNFPVGGIVPVGWYDRSKAAWIPSDNGRIVKILSIDAGGLAVLDVDGSGNPADSSALAALGITDTERQQLASLYAPGKSLWRSPITHFTPWDCNWPVEPEKPVVVPPNKEAKTSDADKPDPCHSNKKKGCIVEAQSQTLGEEIPITGTPFHLHYRSDRVPDYLSGRTIEIPVTESISPSLKEITLNVSVAGQVHRESIIPEPNITRTFIWDGLDGYGRTYQGTAKAQIDICYLYPAVPVSPSEFGDAFSQFSGDGLEIGGNRSTSTISICQNGAIPIGTAMPASFFLGGWTLDVQHAYDPIGGVLNLGYGGRRDTARTLYSIIDTVVGNGAAGSGGDGGPATSAQLSNPHGVTVAPDGSLYIADYGGGRIRRVGPDGIITTVAGNGSSYVFSGDGGPATSAALSFPEDVAVAPDGSLYIADRGNNRIRRVGPDGIITTVAGNGLSGFVGDGGPATSATLSSPQGVALGADGSLYIADRGNYRIRRVGPDGIITTVAGNGLSGFVGDGGPATSATLSSPEDVAVGPDGSLYIADSGNRRIRRVGPDGIITTVAGNGLSGFVGDGGPATSARFYHPRGVAVGPDGSLYIADGTTRRIRRVGPDGIITTAAGNGIYGSGGDGGPATSAQLLEPYGVTVAPDGSLYIATFGNSGRIRRVASSLPGFDFTDIAISSEDGSEIYRFDASGRHLETLDAVTGTPIYTFSYDANGLLISITDLDGDITHVERASDGTPVAIVSADGQRTELTLNAEGYLTTVVNPAGEMRAIQYTTGGLMTEFTDRRGNINRFQYDSVGRLIQDTNAGGGGWTLAHTETGSGYTNTLTSGEGRATAFSVEPLATGDRSQRNTYPDGTVQERLFQTNAQEITTAADATVTTLQEGPDPRFGMQAPVPLSLTIATSAGLNLNTTTQRTAVLADPNDPFSITSLTEAFTVNNRAYSSVYTAAMRTYTNTTPVGRQSTTEVNNKLRPVRAQISGLNPTDYTYDTRGRLTALTEGDGVDSRTTTLAYHDTGAQKGYLASITDAEGRTVSLDYDAAGRVTGETLADGRVIGFGYDANGNLTSLTPPGRPAHQFTYTSTDQTLAYIPPSVSNGGSTGYEYDLDKALTRLTRPDGLALNFSYDAAGRLSTLTTPEGDTNYSYDAGTGKLTGIAAPGGEGLAYTYNGALLTMTFSSGTVNGNVAYTYDNDFRVASINVNGTGPVTYSYDADSLLTKVGNAAAGDFTLSRDPQNGLLTGTSSAASPTLTLQRLRRDDQLCRQADTSELSGPTSLATSSAESPGRWRPSMASPSPTITPTTPPAGLRSETQWCGGRDLWLRRQRQPHPSTVGDRPLRRPGSPARLQRRDLHLHRQRRVGLED